jgi:hypothetical protein
MWLVSGRTHQAPPAVGPHGPDRAPTPAARAASRSRRAIEEDLRRVCALQADMRSGRIRAEQRFATIIARRTDRLLDELLRLPGRPQESTRRRGRGSAPGPGTGAGG